MVSREAFQFFFEHAGYKVGERAKCALALARAEEQAKARGIEFVWEPDDDPDLGDHAYWCPTERLRLAYQAGRPTSLGRLKRHTGHISWCAHEVWHCYALLPNGEIRASLGSIIEPDSAYRRVVQAELAEGALEGICEIQWIDKEGNPTPDCNPAIGEVYNAEREYTTRAGRTLHFERSRTYRICAAHARQIFEEGLQHWHIREY